MIYSAVHKTLVLKISSISAFFKETVNIIAWTAYYENEICDLDSMSLIVALKKAFIPNIQRFVDSVLYTSVLAFHIL